MKKYLFITLFLSISFLINAQNNPTSADNTVTINEDNDKVFVSGDFTYSDIDGDPFTNLEIVGLETTGTLFYDINGNNIVDAGEDVTLNLQIPVANIPRLKFRPNPDDFEIGYDSFNFQVIDDEPRNSITYTMTIDVTSINDEPSFTNSGGNQTVAEDAPAQTVNNWATAIVLGPANEVPPQTATFNVTNNNNGLFSVQPAISAAGTLTYTPAANANGVATVTVNLNDNGGTPNGGDDQSPSINFTITVTAVNDPPTGADNTVTLYENSNITFATGHFNYTDVEGDAFDHIEVISAPGFGTLWVDSDGSGTVNGAEVALASSDVVSTFDINSGYLKFMPAADENGNPYTSFQFRVHDGTQYSTATYTMTIIVTPVNSEPSFTAGGNITVNEDVGAYTFSNWASAIDAGAPDEGGQTLTFHLSNDNNGLFSAQPAVDAVTGDLTFTTAANANGVANVTIYLTDDGGTANGGDDTSPSQAFTITITAVNDSPTGTDNTVTCPENQFYTFASGDFGYSDVEGDAFSQLEITTVPALGNLWVDSNGNGILDGGESPLAANNIVLVSDINSNLLKYSPNADENGNPYTNFDFKVYDGTDFSTLSYTITINVTPINSEPSFTKGADQVINEDAVAQTVNAWATNIDDGDNEVVQVLTFHLTNDNMPMFTVQPAVDPTTGNLTYTPAANANGVANVTIWLTDDGGTANGGDDTSPTQTFTITINPVNDFIQQDQNNPLNVTEGSINNPITNGLLQYSDAVDNTPATSIVYTVTILPTHGTIYISGVPVAVNGTFTQAQIDAGALTYDNDGSESITDAFTFTVTDGEAGTAPTVFNINVTPVNDNPNIDTSPITVGTEGNPYIYNLSASDNDNVGADLSFTDTSAPPLPAWLVLTDNGNGTASLSGTPPFGGPATVDVCITVDDGEAPPGTNQQCWTINLTNSVTVNAGPDDITCNNDEYTLNGSQPPTGYTGEWTVIDGAGIFTDNTLYNTLVSGLNSGIAPNNSNTFRWTITNSDGSFSISDDVVITNNTVVASVTDISNVCGTNAVLQADNALFPGESGLWTVEGAPVPLPVIANPTQRTTAVSGLNYNVNQFRWTVTKGTCSDFAIMNVDVIEVWATAGAPAEICSEPFTVQGNDPALLGGTGLWTVGAGNGAFANAINPTTTVTGSHQDVVNTYVWTVTVNGCTAQASVDVQNNIPTTAVITTLDPSTSCDGTYTISATPADATDPNETGYWTTATAGVIIANPNNATTGVSNLQEGANLFTWHISNGTCPESTADLTINYFFPITVDAGPDATICSDEYSFAGTPLEAGETGVWTFTTGSGNIVNPNSNTTLVTNLQRGINVLQWTVTHDICSSDDLVTITNMNVDAIISTGNPLISCTDPSPLITANDPASQDIGNPATAANGFWTVESGGGVVDAPSSWNTTVSNLDPGANNFVWTISNGFCLDSDTITVINSIPTQAYAGKDTIVCSTSLPNLNGNNYDNTREIGFWRRIAGNATITDISLANTSVTNLDYYCTPWTPDWWTNAAAVNIFEWVIRRGTCESTDQVSVMNGLPETIDAGLDQTVCDNVVNLDALDEASCADDYWWEQLPDIGNYVDPLTGVIIPDNDLQMPFNVHVDNIQDGMTQFIWHKRNNFFDSMGNSIQCELTDTVEITSLGLVEDVQAGPEDATCDDWYQLNATNPSTVFTTGTDVVSGEWSLIFGAGNFDDDSYYNTTVRNMAAYDNIYRWTVTNETKACILSDDVYIHSARPSNASAGPDDVTCKDFAVLSSNVPVRYTSAFWTVSAGGSIIIQNSCTGFTCDAIATNISDSLNIYVWHVVNEYTGGFGGYDASNPLECEVIDSTIIIYRGITAQAGVDIYECGNFTQLAASDPEWNTGVWTGSGTFDDSGTNTSTLFNDVVRGLTPGKNTFTWTISNESCSGSDELVVFGLLPPAPYANVDQTVCSGSVNLNANDVTNYWGVVDPVPPNPVWQEATATGYWTSTNPLVTFGNSTNFNTTASGISIQTEDAFIWHSVNNFTDYVAGLTRTCELMDTMLVYNNSVTATAGSDIFECGVDLVANSFELNAVPAILPMTGLWNQISGPASTIVTPASPTTTVTNVFQDNDYIYQWTVSATRNAVTCTAADDMLVEIRIPSMSVVNPSALEVCVNQAPLVGNIPLTGVGTWSSASGTPGIIDEPSNSVTFVDLVQNGISQWQWTIDREGCTSNDIITVTNNTVTADADLALPNPNSVDICVPTYNLNATDPNIFNVSYNTASGLWTSNLGTTTFINNTIFNTTVGNLSSALPNILTWTITKGSCTATDQIFINNNEFLIDADVDQIVCNGSAILNGEQAGTGTGIWTYQSGSGGNVVTPSQYDTQVTTIVPGGSSLFRWTVTRNGCVAWDEMTVTNDEVHANAGTDQTTCTNIIANMPAANPGAGINGNWQLIFGGGVPADATLYNTSVSGLSPNVNTFRWNVSRSICSDFDEVDIVNNEPADFILNGLTETCDGNSSISVNAYPPDGSGIWTQTAGSGVIFDDTNINTIVTGLEPGNNQYTWTVTNGMCTKSNFIDITNNQVIADAGIPQFVCADSAVFTALNPATNNTQQGNGTWTLLAGNGTFDDNTLYNSIVRNLDIGLNTFNWTLTLGSCSDVSIAQITNNAVQANASNQVVCTNTATFDGNNPGAADGLWTLIGSSGTPNITDNTLNISTVTDLGSGVNTFRWLVGNVAGCKDSIDITINNGEFPTSAGPDQLNLCSTSTVLAGQDHGAGYNGHWVVVAGGATITNSAQYNSPVTGLTPGNNVFRWVVESNATLCQAHDEVVVQNSLPSTAIIVTPIVSAREICSNSLSIEGTQDLFGSGIWTASTEALGTTFGDKTSYQTTINNLEPGNNVLTWTITNGICSSQDQITIVNNEVVSIAGIDQVLCSDNTLLTATDPTSIYPNQGTGYWTNMTGNGALITNSLIENSTVTNLPIGTTTFRWTVEQGICSEVDDVVIANNSVSAIAHNQADCNSSFLLDGNDPSGFGGTGYWEIVGGGSGVITAPSTQYNTTVTGIPNGVTSTLRWTVDNGACNDDIEITVTNNNFSIDAGSLPPICVSNATMNADSPGTGIGEWTLVAGSGIFDNSNSNTTNITGIGQGNNTYRWTVVRDGCTNTDDIIVVNNSPSTALITGPVGTETCDGTATLTASLPNPYYADTQYWKLVSGGATFVDPTTNFTMNVTNLAPGNNIFRWTIERGACMASTDDIIITNNEVVSVAGANQTICDDNIFLNATDPADIYPNQGTGSWLNLSGTGAIISNSLSKNTNVTNLPTGTTSFQWTVTQGNCTESSIVQITNSSVNAIAHNQADCNGTFILDGNDPSGFGGNGYWQIIAGSGTILAPSSQYNTSIVGVPYETTTTLRWLVDNFTCQDSIDITVNNYGFALSAGTNVSQCGDSYTLNADDPTPGSGFWTTIGGSGIISNSTQYDAIVTGLAQGNNVFRWTVTKGLCTSTADVTIENTNPDVAVITSPGPANREVCTNSVTIEGNIPSYGTGKWTAIIGGGTFADDTNHNTLVTSLNPGLNRFVWTLTSGICSSSAQVDIINNEVEAYAGLDFFVCADTAELNAVATNFVYPFQGTGIWEYAGAGTLTIDNSLSNNTIARGIGNGLNTFTWTVFQGNCTKTDNLIVSNYSTLASATDAISCFDNLVLTADPPAPGEVGTWFSFTPGVTYVDQTLYNTVANNLFPGNNTFVWTLDNGYCSDDTIINVNFIEPIANAGTDRNICDDEIFLNAFDPSPGIGVWSVQTGSGSFVDVNNYNTFVTNIGIGTNVYEWEVTDRGCVKSDIVTIINNTPIANVGSDIETCSTTAQLPAAAEQAGESGLWTKIGGSGIVTTPTLFNSEVTNLSPGTNVFQWTVSNGSCSDSKNVNIFNNSVTSISAGLDRDICDNFVTLGALSPQAGETGQWAKVSGDGIISNTALYNATVTNLSRGSNMFSWTIYKGLCDSVDYVTITNNSPTVANTDPDTEICNPIYTLNANSPGPGETGIWTPVFGASGVIVNQNSASSVVHSISAGTNTYRWTISNALCDSYNDIVITNNMINTDAGIDASLCLDTTVLAADNPAPGTGLWSVLNSAGTPIFDNASLYNTVVRNLAKGSNIFKWTATNGGCDAWDLVTISNDIPTIPFAGNDETVCDGTVNLKANNPTVGIGIWTRLGGAGIIANPSNYNTSVTGLSSGGNTFRWTISEGSCEEYDDVLITNELVPADAGIDEHVCGTIYTGLNGNQPSSGETGLWTVTGGTGDFDNPTLYNSGVSGLSGSENVLTWTVTRGACSNSDNVSIFNDTPTNPTVMSDKELCHDTTVIAGNPPITGTGFWSVATGSGDFDDSLANTTTVRNIGPDLNVYRWTIVNGGCNSFADVNITNNSVVAIVGADKNVCGTEAFLNGNEPIVGDTGVWTVTAGGGIIVNNTLYNTQVTNLNVGINKFRWTVSNGCIDYADLVVTNNLYDASASVAGPDVICTDSADLLGSIPIQGSSGHWEIFAGEGNFVNSTDPATRIRNLNKGENTLRWFITKLGCTNFADVSITNNMVVANAGTDVVSCGNDANLSGNELLPGEHGLWTKEAGCGTILTPSNYETVVTGQCSGVNVFKWTITGNGCSDEDFVQINENSFLINAGTNETVCSTEATLTGENPAPGTGLWTTGAGVIINNPTSYITTVSGLHDNSPHTFRWTVQRNGCAAFDEVVVNNYLVHANAGDDNTTCSDVTILSASNPIAGTGQWDIIAGTGVITTPSYYATGVTGLSQGTISFRWTVTHEGCTDSDNVTIINNMSLANAGPDQEKCDTFATLNGTPPLPGGTGHWDVVGGPGIIETPSAYNSVVSNLQRGANTFRWTVTENGCTNGGSLVRVVNNLFDANAGLDQILDPLDTDTYFDANIEADETGQWTIIQGTGNIYSDTSPNSYVSGMPTGENVFSWTVHNLTTGCNASDNVKITVRNFIPDAGPDQIVCIDTTQLNARFEIGATSHTWSIVSGGGQFDDIHDAKTIVRNVKRGLNIYRWTVSFTGYSASDEVNVLLDSIFVSAGDDVSTCSTSIQMDGGQFVGADSLWWTPVGFGGGGDIENNTLYNTMVTNLAPGDSYFEWYVSNGNCFSRDTVMITYNLPPIARFEADPVAFCAPDTVTINNTSTSYPGLTDPDKFFWLMEDFSLPPTFDVNTDIDYVFTNTADWDSIYHIRLIALDYETGCRDTFITEVTAYAAPKLNYTVNPDEPVRIPDANFSFATSPEQSTTDLASYQWDFGDGYNRYDTVINYNFEYNYETPGTYIVRLIGVSDGNCAGSWSDTLIVLPACPWSWQNSGDTIAEGCEDLYVEFLNETDYVSDSLHSKWYFYGDGEVPDGIAPEDTWTYSDNPNYTYPEPGVYHPHFVAWSDECRMSGIPDFTRSQVVIVYQKPIAKFEVSPRKIMLPDQLLLCHNYSEEGVRYYWDFGDNTNGAERTYEQTSHLYTEPGLYDISLEVWSEHNCYDSLRLTKAVIVEREGGIEFPTAFIPNPSGPNGGVYPCGEKYTIDETNEVFFPKQAGVAKYLLEIYNRWGEKIFISNDICTGWDGYVDGVLAPQDVYVWKVSVVYRNGRPDKKYGSVTLLR